MILLKFLLITIMLASTPIVYGQGIDPMYSPGIVQDVISESRSPRAYDWRKNSYELQLGYGYTDEANNFENEVYELMLGLPAEGGIITRVGIRRAIVMGTESSDKVGRTPFTQESTMTRYELVGGFGYSLLEGRNFTRLSPTFGDFENVFMVWLGFHYSHPNASYIPKKNEKPERMPGQSPKNFKYVLELGLRWAIYTPKDYGLYLEFMEHVPLGRTGDLESWTYFAGGIAFAVD